MLHMRIRTIDLLEGLSTCLDAVSNEPRSRLELLFMQPEFPPHAKEVSCMTIEHPYKSAADLHAYTVLAFNAQSSNHISYQP